MHIPKLLAMISVATLGAGSLSVHAQRPDSDMQAIAREQMRQALMKLDATNAAPVAVAPKPVKKVVAPPPAQPTMVIAPAPVKPVPPPPVVVAPPVAPPTKAVPPPTVVVAPAAAPIPEQPKPVVVAAKPKPKPAKSTAFSPFSPIPDTTGTQNPPVMLVIPGESPVVAPGNTLKHSDEKKAREEVRKSLGETAPSGKSEAKFPAEAKMGTETVTAPTQHTVVPGSKEDRLADLLDLYKADKISPQEYHDQRAKIIAEP